MTTDLAKNTKVIEWMQIYVDTYTKKDKRTLQGALNKFSKFLTEQNLAVLTFANLNPLLIEDFISYLENISTGEGARSYYNRVKKMIRHAYRKKILKSNVLV